MMKEVGGNGRPPAKGRPSLGKRLPMEVVRGLTLAHRKLIAQTDSGKKWIHDAGDFPWVQAFEESWTAIRDEALQLLPGVQLMMNEHELLGSKQLTAQADSWKVFALYGAKVPIPENCRRCPTTARLCESVPGLLHAFFSILKKGAHIEPHFAHYNGRLRYHLGLKVPKPDGAARLRVCDDILKWQEGRSFVFDDTFVHEAWNDGEEDRIVLIIDFLRPLPFPFDRMNEAFMRGLMAFIAKMGRRRAEAWENDFGKQLDDLTRPVA
jgi:ornithine lipid ester-linked acyl 2-hydroxylase